MLAPYLQMVQGPNMLTLKFRIQLALATGATAPDFQVPAGSIASATAPGSGVYTMTMRQKYPVFVGGFGQYMADDGTADAYIVGIVPSGYDAATGILTFNMFTDDGDGTYTAENGIEDDWVYFELTFCTNSEQCGSGAIPV